MLYQEDIVKIEAIATEIAKKLVARAMNGFANEITLVRNEMDAVRDKVIVDVDNRMARAVAAEPKPVAEKPAAKKEVK